MDAKTKSAIKSLVLDLRHTLENEFAIALRRYGIFTDRDWSLETPPERLTDPADREVWRRIVTVVKQRMQEGRTLQDASVLATASLDYVRESAFTFLNRLVGLKCLEVRGIIDEVITTRDVYGGRSRVHRDYREEHPTGARAADDALPACLESVWRRVNDELIGYLFDPDDDYTLVWPRYAVLKDCIARINGLEEAAWAEDEIIGWIYQFYNAREKEAIRSRGKPQTPHDVAVINQFFTPRWIVKFLVDNTLGRLWLEMHPGSTRVREKCDYLVPEPVAHPDGQGDKGTGGQGEGKFQLDPHSPVNNPEAEPRREEKPLPQIKLLDPACGTMHFGHYAMEVFDAMYRDARDWGHLRIEDREIPGVILKNNLFGIDIDRRAVQLAALSLFMKARTMHPEARVQQVNLVAADATLPDSDVRERFLERYARTPKVQAAFAQVLDDMDQVAELGSLLRVEERLRELLSDVGRVGRKQDLKALDRRRQRDLPGPVLSGVEGSQPSVRQMGLADLADDEEEAAAWTPQYTLGELREDLRAFARAALNEHDLNAQLFATEADKAVRLLDVLMANYDVVVMNPPYGSSRYLPAWLKKYMRANYPNTSNDVYAAFIERALNKLNSGGYCGALTSRTFLSLSSFEDLRAEVMLKRGWPAAMLDLGFEVLDDATVETAAIVLQEGQRRYQFQSCFFRLNELKNKKEAFQSVSPGEVDDQQEYFYTLDPAEFSKLPKSTFAYWTTSSLRQLFVDYPSFQPAHGLVKQGVATANDVRFSRYRWEVEPREIGKGRKWVTFNNGGFYSKYYFDFNEVINWENDARELKGFDRSVVRNEDLYFREGLTYQFINIKGFNAKPNAPNSVFGVAGHSIFPKHLESKWDYLAVLNSGMFQYLALIVTPSRMYQVGQIASLPVPEQVGAGIAAGMWAKRAHDLKQAWDTGNEICTRFTQTWLLQLAHLGSDAFAKGLGRVLELLGSDVAEAVVPETVTLEAALDSLRTIEEAADSRLDALQAEIDEAVYDLYEIGSDDRALIERELGKRPPELVWPEMEGKSDREKREEHVKRFFSYFARQAVREDDDGIVPLAGCAGQEAYLMDRVRAKLEETFGVATAYELEQEAAQYIGRGVETWIHTYFFHHFHVDLYKKRPILWHLTSGKKDFAVMLDYHRLDRDTLPKVRSQYLWPQMESVRTRLAAARAQEAVATIAELEEELEDLKDFEERLDSVIQGTVKVKLPKWANGPYRNGEPPYDPDLNDGVKVNLLPIQQARLLPVKQVL